MRKIVCTGPLLLGLCLVLSGACVGGEFVGGPGSAGDDDGAGGDDVPPGTPDAAPVATPDAGPPPSYSITLSPPSAEMVLGETKTFTVTVTPEHGFTGTVALAAEGPLPTWLVSFDDATLDVTTGAVTATLTVQIPSDAEAGDAMLAVRGTAGALDKSTSATDLSVKPELVIRIPKGSVDSPENSFGPNGKLTVRYVQPGTKVTWVNDDTVAHRIHADNVNGMNHEPNNMAAGGGSYTVTVTAPGVYNYNCHIHAQMQGTLVVQ